MNGVAWSDAELDTLRDLRARGFSPRQIGREMGRTHGSVVGKIRKLDLPLASADLREAAQASSIKAGQRQAVAARWRKSGEAQAPVDSDAHLLSYSEIIPIAKRYGCWDERKLQFDLQVLNPKLIANGYRPLRIRLWQPGQRELPARELRV